MTSTTSNKGLNLVENIQKVLFFLSLLIIPISVVPLPWDTTEYSMSISMLIFATLVLALELTKLFWVGRTVIRRTLVDSGLVLLAGSILLSTVFSSSMQTSLWGFDYRLGSGAVLFTTALIYSYSARIFLKNFEDVMTSVRFLSVGITISAILSILSFWGINILNTVPGFDSHFTVGLPLYSSSRVSLIVWGVSLMISASLTFEALRIGKIPNLIYPLFSFLTTLLAITLFSLVSGWQQVALLTVATVSLLVLPLLRKRPLNKTYVWTLLSLSGLLLLAFLLFRVPQLKELLVRDSSSLITQLTIDPQVSWKVATSSISESVVRGFIGLGQDTFSMGYNLYRPLTSETILLNATNFTNANIHLVNVLATRGAIGVIVWILLGFFLVKSAFDALRKNKFDTTGDFFIVLLDLSVLYVYLSSAFIYFNFLTVFILLILISLSTVLKNDRFGGDIESFILNLGIFLKKPGENNSRPIATGAVVIVVALVLVSLTFIARYSLSSAYVLQAERISTKGREMNEREGLSEREKSQILIDSSNLYGRAISLSPNNDVLHRRGSLIVMQYVDYLAQKYNETEIESEKKDLFEQISTYIEIAVEEAKRATDANSQTYANWSTRSSVYSKLVGLGLTSYTRSALTSMQMAAQLNPANYELYYNAAQLYVVNNDNDLALRTLSQVFAINPDHIPSLILGGELSLKDGDSRQALRYFEDAKRVMDNVGGGSTDVYDYVVEKIAQLDQGSIKQESGQQNDQENDSQDPLGQD